MNTQNFTKKYSAPQGNKFAGQKRSYKQYESGNEEQKAEGIIHFKFAIGQLIFAMIESDISETQLRTRTFLEIDTEVGGILTKISELRDKIKAVKADSAQHFDKAFYFNLEACDKDGVDYVAIKRDREIVEVTPVSGELSTAEGLDKYVSALNQLFLGKQRAAEYQKFAEKAGITALLQDLKRRRTEEKSVAQSTSSTQLVNSGAVGEVQVGQCTAVGASVTSELCPKEGDQ